jgi:hypothetical protein
MLSVYILEYEWIRVRRVRDRMVIGIITTYAISAHYHKCCKLESRPSQMYSIPHYVMKFVSDLRQVAKQIAYVLKDRFLSFIFFFYLRRYPDCFMHKYV